MDKHPQPASDAKRAPIVDRRYLLAFSIVTTLFFAWAFAASLNDVLIRQFQKALALTRTQSSLIQLAFYIGYFCAALPAGLVIRRAGYKRTIIIGLLLYAVGALLFYPAAEVQRYGFFLIALYVIAFGLAFLETAANPYVSILGHPATASARLNLSQSFYGLGAIFGPIIGGLFIFSGIEHTPTQLSAMTAGQVALYRTAEAANVKGPYVAIGIAILLLALLGDVAAVQHDAVHGRMDPHLEPVVQAGHVLLELDAAAATRTVELRDRTEFGPVES